MPQGSDWYQRAMRAHMNCVENLPLYGALIVALNATRLQSGTVNRVAVMLLTARIGRLLPTSAATALRFSPFVVQVVCMIAMCAVIAAALFP